jgi:nucleotide-binding universal stress UspA family protein
MTYRSLLVYLDQDPHCATRSGAAMVLAKALDCHLAGVAPTGLIDLPTRLESAATLIEFAGLAWDTLRSQAERTADRFRDDCRVAGLKSFEAFIDESDKAQSLVRSAHCSDLTVLTQADPSAADHRAAQDLVEKVVLYSARPTLLVPCVGQFDSIGTHAMVAWDDSREAARAVSDALPLLRRAHQVDVIGWGEAGGLDQKTLHQRLDALRQWLMRQGVSAALRVETPSSSIADAMLTRAAESGADLIVMGAYGHARWAERVLGGATRGLLDAMTVPVLMSH